MLRIANSVCPSRMAMTHPTTAIRPAGEADIPAIFSIRTAVTENHMSAAELAAAGITPAMVATSMRAGTAALWLATHRGQACGFAMARADKGDLFALFVLRHAEGLGIGTALLQEAETWLGAHGVTEAWLMTGGEPGLRAPGFYESRCWRLDGTDEDGTLRYVKRLETA